VLQDPDKASDLEAESPESYAQRKKISIIENPQQRRKVDMANGNGSMTKDELLNCVDEALDVLQSAYVPEADRETLAQAVGDAIAALEGDLDDDSSDLDDADDDDDGQ
jgi:hypothetical protein